jgi:Fur family transcriptional regulator, peroxide stress response regulator
MERYRGIGVKLTPQRLAILEYLEGNENHPSADEIYKAVSKKYPTMSVATVYNTLETLSKRGRIRELSIDPDKKRFDPNTKAHHHLICVKCKKIRDIRGAMPLKMPPAEPADFEILGHHIEFYGLCSECKSAEAPDESS